MPIDLHTVRAAARLIALDPILWEIRATRAHSLHSIAARLNDRGIRTARGARWRAEQVKRVLAQAENARAALDCFWRLPPAAWEGRPEDLL